MITLFGFGFDKGLLTTDHGLLESYPYIWKCVLLSVIQSATSRDTVLVVAVSPYEHC